MTTTNYALRNIKNGKYLNLHRNGCIHPESLEPHICLIEKPSRDNALLYKETLTLLKEVAPSSLDKSLSSIIPYLQSSDDLEVVEFTITYDNSKRRTKRSGVVYPFVPEHNKSLFSAIIPIPLITRDCCVFIPASSPAQALEILKGKIEDLQLEYNQNIFRSENPPNEDIVNYNLELLEFKVNPKWNLRDGFPNKDLMLFFVTDQFIHRF